MDGEGDEEKKREANEEEELGTEKEVEGADLAWSSLIRSRPSSLVHSGSLRWMTSLWIKTV